MVGEQPGGALDPSRRARSPVVLAALWRLRDLVRDALVRMRDRARGRSSRADAARSDRGRSAQITASLACPPDVLDLQVVADDLGFETIALRGYLGAQHHRALFAALQKTAGPKVLDLRAAVVTSDVFHALAASGNCTPARVPRLAIILDFPHWAIFRELADRCAARLSSIGIATAVVYEQQTCGMGLVSWFSEGPLPVNVGGVVAWLCSQWQPAPIWPLVIAALGDLLRAHADPASAATLYAEAAHLSLRCGGDAEAIGFACEALHRTGEAPSRERCRSVRALAEAMIRQGHAAQGAKLLSAAIAIAAAIEDPIEGAIARCQAGLHALRCQEYPVAAHHFRAGIALVQREQPEMLATLHHNLARALVHLGSRKAASHAARALLLRPDKHSSAADADRLLLGSIRDGSAFFN